jgi:hypothetical protein
LVKEFPKREKPEFRLPKIDLQVSPGVTRR